MNANPSRPRPAEWEETAQLLPPVERDLPAGRHQFHKERLMTQIHQATQADQATQATGAPRPPRRNRFLRPAVLLPVTALALAGAVLGGVAIVNDGDGGSTATGTTAGGSKGVTLLLDRVALVSANISTPKVKPGQFIYIASKNAGTNTVTDNGKTSLVNSPLHLRQT
jgi:ferric-dicitrate binding protein FerR (iron transport regulator)